MEESQYLPYGKDLYRDVIHESNFFGYCMRNIGNVHIPYLENYCNSLEAWYHDLNVEYVRYEEKFNKTMNMFNAIISDSWFRDRYSSQIDMVQYDCDCARESFFRIHTEIQRQNDINEIKANHVGGVLNLVHSRMANIREFIG